MRSLAGYWANLLSMNCCNVSISLLYVMTLYQMLGCIVDSYIMCTSLGSMSMINMNNGSCCSSNVAVKQITCVCWLIKSRNCNTLGRNFFVNCNTVQHLSTMICSNCLFNIFVFMKLANNCDTADLAITNMTRALYSSTRLSLYIAHRIPSLQHQLAMSSCNMIFGITTIVTLSYDAAASNMNNKLLLLPMRIIMIIQGWLLTMASNASYCLPRNQAQALYIFFNWASTSICCICYYLSNFWLSYSCLILCLMSRLTFYTLYNNRNCMNQC